MKGHLNIRGQVIRVWAKMMVVMLTEIRNIKKVHIWEDKGLELRPHLVLITKQTNSN